MEAILKVRRKGVLIIPKNLRDASGIHEGDEVIVEAKDNMLIIRPLKPKIVDIDPGVIDKLLAEEYGDEARKYEGLFKGG